MSAAVYLVLAMVSCGIPAPAPSPTEAVPRAVPLAGSEGFGVTTEVRVALREQPLLSAPMRRFIPRGTILRVSTESESRHRLGGCLAPFVAVTLEDQTWWIHGCELQRFSTRVEAQRFALRLVPPPANSGQD